MTDTAETPTQIATSNFFMALDVVEDDYAGNLDASLNAYYQNVIDSVGAKGLIEGAGAFTDWADLARQVAINVRRRTRVLVSDGIMTNAEANAAVLKRVRRAVADRARSLRVARFAAALR